MPNYNFLMLLIFIAWFDWQVMKTQNFTVFYKPEYRWEADEFLTNLEFYRPFAVEMTDHDLKPVRVIVEDLGTYSNGIADPFLGKMQVFTFPDNINEGLTLQENWPRAVTFHELMHMAHLSRTSGLSKFLNSCFGNIFSPNMYAPMWLIEGIAVYEESQLSPYEGRLNDGYYNHYAKIRAESMPGLIEITNEPLRYPVDQSYLYGGTFTQYIIKTYGIKAYRDYTRIYGYYFWAPFTVLLPVLGIDMAMRKSIGRDFPRLHWQYQQIINNEPLDPTAQGSRLTDRGWYIGSMTRQGTNLYFNRICLSKAGAFDIYSLDCINVYDIRHGEEKTILNINSTITLPLRIQDDKLYYAVSEIKRGAANSYLQGFGYTSRLYYLDLSTGKKEFIIEHDIRSYCLCPDGSLLFACDLKHKYGSELWFGQNEFEKIMETDYLVFDLIANDNYLVATAARAHKNADICLVDTVSGRIEPIVITPWNEGQLHFKDESTLIFSANYQGQHFAYELNMNDLAVKELTSTFAHWPVIINNEIYYAGLNAQGFDLYKLPYHPKSYTNSDQPLTGTNSVLTPVSSRPGNIWDLLVTLEPAARIPIIYPVNDGFTSWQPGFFIFGADAVLENIYRAVMTFDDYRNTIYYDIDWRTDIMMPLRINFNAKPDFLKLSLSYPLYIQLRPGINNLSFLMDVRSFDNYSRKEFAPSIFLRYQKSPHYFYLQGRLPYERQSWHSNINRSAQQLLTGLKLRTNNCSFQISTYIFNDPDNPDLPRLPIRGYNDLSSHQGLSFQSAFDQKFLAIRWGLWNPNIFIEDIFGSIFFDAAINHNRELYWATGFELKTEIKAGFGYIKFIPIIGLSLNRSSEINIYINIQPATENPY